MLQMSQVSISSVLFTLQCEVDPDLTFPFTLQKSTRWQVVKRRGA